MNINRWLLPEGIDEVMPDEARQLEAMRRQLLDLFDCWGYEMVIPPFVEYIESLLTGMGNDLDLQTFKLIDQRNGRMMGVRADMTPQVARIDAHRLNRDEPTRLCYVGTVLRTQGDDFGGSRSITQIGAELYGHAGIDSDIELLSLMLAMLNACEIASVNVDLGHVAIFRGLAQQAGLNEEQETALFDALQRKAAPEIEMLLTDWKLATQPRAMLTALIWLNGDASVLDEARTKLAKANDSVHKALAELQTVADSLQAQHPQTPLHFDLAELRGYNYHTGLVFAAYQPGMGQAIAQGGRYDDIGIVFGRARPATGFSANLRTLLQQKELQQKNSTGGSRSAIYAPAGNDMALLNKINELRQSGERVVQALPGQVGDVAAMNCERELVLNNSNWVIKAIS